jgi:transposase
MRVAATINLSNEDRDWLTAIVKSSLSSIRLHERCQIVLFAADGLRDEEIARKLGITRQKSARWRSRFIKHGRAGIEFDAPGRGRKHTYPSDIRRLVVRVTTSETPPQATHWSRALMAKHLGLSESTVGRIWREHGLKPHLLRGFKLSKDPQFAEKVEDVVGLYLHAPEHALVFSCDEKSQVQALDRSQPGLPLKKGRAGTMTHDYVRHGTTTLFAALNVSDGTVIGQCQNRHRHQEWLQFLKLIDSRTPPDREIHLILDNYATHKHASVKKWLAKHPRFHLHFTPTGASWLNMVERFFRDLTERRLRRGIFKSLPELVAALEDYLAHHNENPSPFVWTAKANDILKKVARARKTLHKAVK